MPSIKRVHYFAGQILSADDFQVEQDYLLQKQRLRNLATLGAGVVYGLQVSATTTGVRVAPGLAIDRHGREILLTEPEIIPYPPALQDALLLISYRETLTDPVPAPTWDNVQYTRIEEGYLIELVPVGPVNAESLILSRLEKGSQGWHIVPHPSLNGLWAVLAALGFGFALSCYAGWRITTRL